MSMVFIAFDRLQEQLHGALSARLWKAACRWTQRSADDRVI